MRLRWCRAVLLQFLRRWGAYLLITAAVLGTGADAGPEALGALAAWVVLPLFFAASRGLVQGLGAALLQGLLGALIIVALSPWLLPQRWLEAERALPLQAADTRRSDLRLSLWALLPLWAVYASGALALLARHTPWLQGHGAAALVALLISAAASVALGTAWLQRRRQPPRARPAAAQRASRGKVSARSWVWALLATPLWRGPARRSGRWLALSSALLLLPAPGLMLWPAGGGWWLAAAGAAALVACTRAIALLLEDYAPLVQASAPLPLSPARLWRSVRALALLPLVPHALALGAVLRPLPLRGSVAAAFGIAVAGTCALQVAGAPEANDARAARWWFCLVVVVALASEVFP